MIPLATWFERGLTSLEGLGTSEPTACKADFLACREAEIAEIKAALRVEIEAELATNFAAQLISERQAITADLQEQSASHVEEQAITLSQSLVTALGDIKTILACELSRLVSPLLTRHAVASGHEEFLETLMKTVLTGPATSVSIHAPEPLLGRLREKCAVAQVTAKFVESNDIEARAECDDTIVETNIREFLNSSGLNAS